MNTFWRVAGQFLSLLGFWLVLSGEFRALFVTMGVVSAAVVTALTHDLVARALGDRAVAQTRPARRLWRSTVYVLWLTSRVLVASVQVAYFALHPRLLLRPAMLCFRVPLDSQLARVIFANSITLVPGTMTLRVTDDEFLVHALVPAAADDLVSGKMQRMVGSIFLEDPGPPEAVDWNPATEEAPS